MTTKTTRLILILVFGVPLAIFVGSVIYNATTVLPPAPFPNPNGYGDLVRSVKMLDPKTGHYSTNPSDLQALVLANVDALQLARAGLQKKCRVPLDFSSGSSAGLHSMEMKDLACAFEAEGKLAEIQGRENDAAVSYLDIIHLGNESARGGVIIDQLVGTVLESIGTIDLRALAPKLDAKVCREDAAKLEDLDAQKQTWDDVMEQENEWSHRAYPSMKDELVRLLEYKSVRKINGDAHRTCEEQQAKTLRLIIDLAARAYTLDNGHAPADVANLVPNYLKAIPQDPLTGTNMVY